MNQGADKYIVHWLIWTISPRHQRKLGGVECLIKRELEDYVSITNDGKHAYYM